MKKALRKKLLAKKEKLKNSGGFKTFIVKEGTTRFRILATGDESDWSESITTFFLGKKHGTVISPSSPVIGGKCALLREYEKLSSSKSESDRKFASRLKPGQKFVVAAYRYKDEKGKEVDTENGVKLLVVGKGIINQLIDLFLDEDEAGDFTDEQNGYDIKIVRTGSGKNNTEYDARPCKPTKIYKKYKGIYDLGKMIQEIAPSYEETKAILKDFKNSPEDEDEDDNTSKKEKSGKKKKNRDL